MIIANKQHPFFENLMIKQAIKPTKYRPLKYVKWLEDSGKLMLFNLMSNEAVILDEEEKDTFYNCDKNGEAFEKLVEKYFLVPADFDDDKFCEQFENMTDLVRNRFDNSGLNSFTIFPTTDCNARCFYCFESGCTKKTMTEKTAEDVADYIIRKNTGDKVSLHWFGGEPLYNKKAINIICSKIKEKGIEYKSEMTSNGYLFDDETVKEAVELWRLKSVQITFDGTEKIYNNIKSYIYKDDPSPFNTVIRNLGELLKAGVVVKVRLNIDKYNYEDLFNLTDFLFDKFNKFPNFVIYPHTLFDNETEFIANRKIEDVIFIENKCEELEEKIVAVSPKSALPVRFKKDVFRCMADNDKAVMILPDGKLSKCEHNIDDHTFGTIYSDDWDFSEILWYKAMRLPSENCKSCEYRPVCRGLSVCPSTPNGCDEHEKQKKYDKTVKILNNFFETYKKSEVKK